MSNYTLPVPSCCTFFSDVESSALLTDVMDSLTVDRDLAVKNKIELAESGNSKAANEVIVPPLRSRSVIAAKLMELGFVADRRELGRQSRGRNHCLNSARRGALNVDLDTSSLGTATVAKRRRRKPDDSSSSEELHFPEDDMDVPSDSEEGVDMDHAKDEVSRHRLYFLLFFVYHCGYKQNSGVE